MSFLFAFFLLEIEVSGCCGEQDQEELKNCSPEIVGGYEERRGKGKFWRTGIVIMSFLFAISIYIDYCCWRMYMLILI